MSLPLAAVEDVLFDAADALRVPVLLLALLALALVLVEAGALVVELSRRRRRDLRQLEEAARTARAAALAGDLPTAQLALRPGVNSAAMGVALGRLVGDVGRPGQSNRLAKTLADFDLGSLRRLERTRLLVRAGPALGLMGTLIPLSPALSGLARGDTAELTENLRVAFSVTVLGLLVGAVAFGVSLVRDRLYAQDLSDLEFVASALDGDLG